MCENSTSTTNTPIVPNYFKCIDSLFLCYRLYLVDFGENITGVYSGLFDSLQESIKSEVDI